MRLGRIGVIGECRLLFVGLRQHGNELFKRRIVVARNRGLDYRLDPMVAGLTARITPARSAGVCGSSPVRCRQRATHSS
jgi:hypothetical protein